MGRRRKKKKREEEEEEEREEEEEEEEEDMPTKQWNIYRQIYYKQADSVIIQTS